jgi:hypothetical protein
MGDKMLRNYFLTLFHIEAKKNISKTILTKDLRELNVLV